MRDYPENPEAAVVADLAQQAGLVNLAMVDPADPKLLLVRENDVVRVLDVEKYAMHPSRRSGAVEFDEPESFASYVNEFKHDGETRFYCSLVEPQALAILNDDRPDPAVSSPGDPPAGAWRDHVAILRLVRTPEWERWRSMDGAMHSQTEFAEFLELNLRDITDPDAATLVEIARAFTVSSDIQFRSAQNLATGETQFAYDEQHQATAGGTKNIAVPKEFTLLIAPFQGTPTISVTARLRYRLRGGGLTLGFMLDNPSDIEREGFRSIVEHVSAQIELPALYGRPAPPPRPR